MQYGFFFNCERCVGCRACQVACKDKNDLPVGVLFRQVRTFETGAFPNPGYYHYSSSCNHCADPVCVAACPTGAMYVADDGTVQHKDDVCIGCRSCVMSCPYGAPQYVSDEGIVRKCDACADVRAEGGNPVCVDACPQRALEWGDIEELRARHPDAVSDLPILPSSEDTHPSLLIQPRNCALESDFRQKII